MKNPFFAQGSFTIDPNASPDELARRRERIMDMMKGTGQAKYVGQGVADLFKGILAGRQLGQINKAESAQRASFNDQWAGLFGGGSSSAGTRGAPMGDYSGQGYTPPKEENPMFPLGQTGEAPAVAEFPLGEAVSGKPTERQIYDGLLARGLPEHIAQGFMMNFRDESGFDPGINEAAPIVPGSRGGFGLYQLTGPRRTAYEAFANERGVSPDDWNAQLDFLMTELQGPEARAWSTIASTKDAGSAAAAIASDFLRPAKEHLDRRVSNYTGGGGYDVAQLDIGTLAQLAASPFATPAQKAIVGALMQQQMNMLDPAYQLGLEKSQLELEALRNPKPDPVKGVEFGDNLVNPYTGEIIAEGQADTTLKIEELADGRKYYVDPTGVQPPRLVNPALDVPPTKPKGYTESEQKLVLFRNMQEESAPILEQLEAQWNPANLGDKVAGWALGGNYFASQEGQMYSAAAASWAEGALRIATGAAATEPEIQRTVSTYFAQPGDTAATIEFKRNLRAMYNRSIYAALNEEGGAEGKLALPADFAAKSKPSEPERFTDFESYAADPRTQAAAKKYGVTVEEMWTIYQENN